MKKLAAMFLALSVLTGCIEAEPFLPKVTFDRLDVRDLTWTDIGADFVFNVKNPNPIEIGLTSFAYALEFEEVQLLEGLNSDGFKLKADGNSDLILPLDFIFAETWETVQATKGEDIVDFRLNGKFGFDTPVGEVKIPYDEAGAFPALRTPKFKFNGIRLTELDFTQAALEVDLGVTNEHGSTLFFDNFAYGLDIAGAPVATGLVQTFDVNGDQDGVVTLPIVVNLLTVGTVVFDSILNKTPLNMGLNADVDVDTPFGILPLSVNEQGDVSFLN